MNNTGRCLKTLQAEDSLQEIVKLVGMDALSSEDRLTLDVAQSIREDFLQQNAFDDSDSYSPLEKQDALLSLIFHYEDCARAAIAAGADIQKICDLPVHEQIARAKSAPNEGFAPIYDAIRVAIDREIEVLVANVEKD